MLYLDEACNQPERLKDDITPDDENQTIEG